MYDIIITDCQFCHFAISRKNDKTKKQYFKKQTEFKQ